MKKDIILAGVGGQGILSIATIIGHVAVKKNLHLKQAEVHGMSQRGGDVQSHLRISDKPIFSDLVPHGGADIILSVEPMESLRYLPWLKKEGWVITNTSPYINITNYPEMDVILGELKKRKNHIAIPAEDLAAEAGTKRAMNIVMLGAAAQFLGIDFAELEDGIRAVFGRKGDKIVDVNLKALRAGRDFTDKATA
ncbi:indolepyruvate oxidoreductase subunit beta [Myxococcota bacterium]|nr:indolepyruvate oxidoreductase subunit beta [Myxococcota bacterium]MBU1537979.1 indolepyruvate oxidoreductase subunit beta [Myxococcota bacterium]